MVNNLININIGNLFTLYVIKKIILFLPILIIKTNKLISRVKNKYLLLTFPPPRPATQTHTTLTTFTNKHRTAVILGIRIPFKYDMTYGIPLPAAEG